MNDEYAQRCLDALAESPYVLCTSGNPHAVCAIVGEALLKQGEHVLWLYSQDSGRPCPSFSGRVEFAEMSEKRFPSFTTIICPDAQRLHPACFFKKIVPHLSMRNCKLLFVEGYLHNAERLISMMSIDTDAPFDQRPDTDQLITTLSRLTVDNNVQFFKRIE